MRRIAALAGVVAMLIATAPGVGADPVGGEPVPVPGGEPVPAPDGPTLSLADLGSQDAITFPVNRDVTTTTVTFPVPSGLTPALFKARIELPVSLRFGNLAVTQGDRTIHRQLLPTQDQAEIVVPLAGVQAFGDWVSLTLTMTVVPIEGYCWDQTAPIRMVGGAVTFSGVDRPPTSVADFLPPVLRTVTIGIPGKPSPAESSAAVQLAAAVAKRNGQQPEVVVVPLPNGADTLPGPVAPLQRQFVVKEGPTKGLSLQGAPGAQVLRVSGTGNDLAGQVRLLTDDAARYAVSTTSVAESLPAQNLLGDSTSVGQITGGGLTAEALWPKVGIKFDQTQWGHPLAEVSMHLIGSYTPLPPNFNGELVATVDGEAVGRWPAEAAGTIDQTLTIPDRLLKRFTTLDVSLIATGIAGQCGDHLPIQLRIDGSTTINVKSANPPVLQGFQSMPQALMPLIRVGIGTDAFGDTARAAQIMVGLQRSSAVPLLTEVTTLQQAIASTDPVVLISPDGAVGKSIALPFSADQGRIDVTGVDAQGQSVELNLDPAKGFGSLQTVFDGQRSILVATSSGPPTLLDDLLRYLAGEPGRWQSLNGRAILSTPGAEPITVPNPQVDYSAQPAPSASAQANWFWWAVGGVAVVAAAGALFILRRAGRK